jgi:hypothetical protein
MCGCRLYKLNVELMEAAEEGNVTAVAAALAAGAFTFSSLRP